MSNKVKSVCETISGELFHKASVVCWVSSWDHPQFVIALWVGKTQLVLSFKEKAFVDCQFIEDDDMFYTEEEASRVLNICRDKTKVEISLTEIGKAFQVDPKLIKIVQDK